MNKTKNIKNKNRKVIIFFIILTFLVISYFIFKNSNKPKFVDLYCKVKNNIQNIENANFEVASYNKKKNRFFIRRDTLGIEFIIDNDSINVLNNSLEIIKPFEERYKIQIDPKLQKEFVNEYKGIIFFCINNNLSVIQIDTLVEKNISIYFDITNIDAKSIPSCKNELDENNCEGVFIYDKSGNINLDDYSFGKLNKLDNLWYFFYYERKRP